MKLRNKKTWEIGEFFCSGDPCMEEITLGVEFKNGETVKYNSLSKMAEEWEDYEEPKSYWAVDYITCGVDELVIDPKDPEMDDFNKEIGNYFETKEEAEKAVEKLKAWKRLKDKGFKFRRYEIYQSVLDECETTHIEATILANKVDAQDDLDLLFGGEE